MYCTRFSRSSIGVWRQGSVTWRRIHDGVFVEYLNDKGEKLDDEKRRELQFEDELSIFALAMERQRRYKIGMGLVRQTYAAALRSAQVYRME